MVMAIFQIDWSSEESCYAMVDFEIYLRDVGFQYLVEDWVRSYRVVEFVALPCPN